MRTPGQEQAIDELNRVVAVGHGAVQIDGVRESGASVVVGVGIDCRGFPHAEGGVSLRQREWFDICIPSKFPFKHPRVFVRHRRWAGTPHVQWAKFICLYAAPSVEWVVSDGMFGLLDRLILWLHKASTNELDPVEGARHPPVVYAASSTPLFIPRVDAPAFDGTSWLGTAAFTAPSPHRRDIVGWAGIAEPSEAGTTRAAAVLLAEPLSFEFPKKLAALIAALGRAGVSKGLLYLVLGAAALDLDDDAEDPLYVVIGTPMRSTSAGEPRQHLAVWRLDPVAASALATLLGLVAKDRLQEAVDGLETAIDNWADVADVQWCTVREARSEVTQDRATGSPLQALAGMTVALWGCGAIGSHLAELLARAGVERLILRDPATVAPGLLGRQRFDDIDIGAKKVDALKRRLEAIRPDLDVEAYATDVISDDGIADDWSDGAALVIDATANSSVNRYLDLLRKRQPGRAHVATTVFGHTAEHCLVTFCPATAAAGPADVARKAKLEALRRPELVEYGNEFWPEPPRTDLFQPEPGCSDPTFTGTAAEVSALSARMLYTIAAEVNAMRDDATATFDALKDTTMAHTLHFLRDLRLADQFRGYDVRIAPAAVAEIRAWTRRAERLAPDVETGGILFGERDDSLRVIWVTDVLGPPPDSASSEAGFVCGTAGVEDAARFFDGRARGSSRPIGMWHTHPDGQTVPSPTDFGGMRQLVDDVERPLPKQLLVIVGGTGDDHTIAGYVYEAGRRSVIPWIIQAHQLPPAEKPAHRIGLALSGGGFRAVAYHLGVLRALHDRGVLGHVDVVSSVSGGSIIAAMWAYSDEPFEVFDRRVVGLLKSGLALRIAQRAFLSMRAPQAAAATVVAGSGKITVTGLSLVANLGRRVVRRPRKPAPKPPFRRFVNRTTALQDVLEARLFGDTRMSGTRRDVAVVINACELRGGNAFRFGSTESGSSRFGRLTANDVLVARAVAASAAYPVAFPASDTSESFTAFDGTEHAERVLLTDGGVYDNLGITALDPGRSSRYSTNVHRVDYVVSADAGQGVLDVDKWPLWWFGRMKRSFESVYRKVQDGGKSLLHEQRASGALRGFALPLLGMHDTALPLRPPDLVPRDAVVGYPTNLSAMTDEHLALLTLRGEKLTRLVIELHCPEIA